MSAPGPILGDVVASPRRPPRRSQTGDSAPIARVAGVEREMTDEERDLAYLVVELSRVSAESADREAALRAAREDCGRLGGRMAAVERLVAGVSEQIVAERAAADALVREAHEQASAAIGLAEERASAALRAAHATIRDAEAQAGADAQAAAAEREVSRPTALERRLRAELELVRRERAEQEARMRAELERATTEKLELRTRLGICEHALGEREADLQRERQLADEALRWASSVERELAQPESPAGGSEFCAVKPPAEPQVAVVRRRGSRVRLRPAR